MATEGYGVGFGPALTRLYHTIENSMTAVKWNLIELCTPHLPFGPDMIPKRAGDAAVVTGGARGIGAEIVKKLLQADMHVFVGCRNIDSGNLMIKKLRDSGITTGSAECIPLDLTSLNSVRKFAKSILEVNLPIHILINNAGIMWVPYELTPDKFESHFQVNYLGHFLLTNLLLPRLVNTGKKGKFSRIINVSSIAQYGGNIQFDNLQMKQNYSPARAYQNTKLMQVLSSNYLEAKFKSNNLQVSAFSVHPGIIVTDLYNTVFGFSIFRNIIRHIWKTAEQGADGIVFTALSPDMENRGGLLLGNCKQMPQIEQALNTDTQWLLWEASCDLVGIDKNRLNISLIPVQPLTTVTAQ